MNVIYLRTSTEEQNPENQLKDCMELSAELKIDNPEVFQEKKSAWKQESKREEFEKIKKLIKSRKIKVLIVWDLDRIYRNRKHLSSFFMLCKSYGCKIYSFRQKFLEDINKSPEPWNEMLFDNLIFILGWIAEEESNKRSERVRAAIRINDEGEAFSKKGKRWGRKSIPKKVRDKVIELYLKGISYSRIREEVIYWDHNNNRKQLSKGTISSIVNQYKQIVKT